MQKQWFVVEARKAHENGTIKLYIFDDSVDKVRARKLPGICRGIFHVWSATAEEVQLIYETIIDLDTKGIMPIIWAKTMFVASDMNYYKFKGKKWFELKLAFVDFEKNAKSESFYLFADENNKGERYVKSQLEMKVDRVKDFLKSHGYTVLSDKGFVVNSKIIEIGRSKQGWVSEKVKDKIEVGWNLSEFEAEKFFFTTNKKIMEQFISNERKKAEHELRKENV